MTPLDDRLARQLKFIAATDALKGVERRTRPIGLARRENSAEHSWQVTLTALLLAEHADADIDILRVLKMLLIHDIPEVDVGDVFHYDKEAIASLHEQEAAAAGRLFGLLPSDQRDELLSLWQEFEACESADARFAAAVDRFMAFLMNSNNEGGTWVEYSLSVSQVLAKNAHIVSGSAAIWEAVEQIVTEASRNAYLAADHD